MSPGLKFEELALHPLLIGLYPSSTPRARWTPVKRDAG